MSHDIYKVKKSSSKWSLTCNDVGVSTHVFCDSAWTKAKSLAESNNGIGVLFSVLNKKQHSIAFGEYWLDKPVYEGVN